MPIKIKDGNGCRIWVIVLSLLLILNVAFTSYFYPLFYYYFWVTKATWASALYLRLNGTITLPFVKDNIPKNWKLIETDHFKLYAPNNWISGSIPNGDNEYIGLSQKFIDGKDWDFAIDTSSEKTIKEALANKMGDVLKLQISVPKYRDPSYRQLSQIYFSKYKGFLLIDTIFFKHNKNIYKVYVDNTSEEYLNVLSTLEIKD